MTEKGIYFVTRQRNNAKYRVLERRGANGAQSVTSDQVIELTGLQFMDKALPRLRRIGYRDSDTGKHYVFLTNHFGLSAKTIADVYKDRWQIELFFKWIKQNLKIKKFLGQSENAVRIQILVALITYLIADSYRRLCESTQGFYLWLAELKSTLFQRPKLEYEVLKRRRKWQSDTQKHQIVMAL